MDTQTTGPVAAGAPTQIQPPIKVKYVLYARKSTESEERQILSIDSQVKEMLEIAARDGLEIVDIRRESHSAKDSGERPVFTEILRDIRGGRFNGILTWAPDRLSRNAGDLGSLVDLMDQKLLVEIKTYGQTFTNDPSQKFLLMILCSQAKLENDNKSVNVKRGLRMRCEMGLWPAPAPTGYLNEKRTDRKGYIIIDPQRAPVIKQMFEKIAYGGWSGRKIYNWLKFDMNFRSATSGKPLTLSNIYRLLQTPLFYGTFEYPAGSGNFYTGKHDPIITKELYEDAQKQLKRDQITRGESKEFAFTRLMFCGSCGSGISAYEKFKEIKSTKTMARYVYYTCNHSKRTECRNKAIREEELVEQLIGLMGQVELNILEIQKRFNEEMKRHAKFQRSFLGMKKTEEEEQFDPVKYASYVLREGSAGEKRELLGAVKSKLILKDKKIIKEDLENAINVVE